MKIINFSGHAIELESEPAFKLGETVAYKKLECLILSRVRTIVLLNRIWYYYLENSEEQFSWKDLFKVEN